MSSKKMGVLQKSFLLIILSIFIGIFIFGLFCKDADVSMMCMYAGFPIMIVVGIFDMERFNNELNNKVKDKDVK